MSAVFASMPSETVAADVQQHLAPLVGAVRGSGTGPRTTSSGRATTRRTTGSRRRRSGRSAVDDRELVGGEDELRVDVVARLGGRAQQRVRARPGRGDDLGRRRRARPSNGAAAAVTSRASPGSRSARNVPGRPQVLAVGEPARGLLARADAAVPLAARPPSPRRRPGRRPRRRSRRPSARRGRRRTRSALRARCARCRAASARAAPGRSARSSRWTTPTAARPWAIASSRSSTTSPTCQRQRGTPWSSSNETSSSCPRGSTAAGPLVRWPGGTRASPTTSTGSSAARPSVRLRRPVDRDDEQPVVAARAQPRDGAHRVAADPVGDEPLAAAASSSAPQVAVPRRSSGGCLRRLHQLAERRIRPRPRMIRSATSPVQPVWCDAPRPGAVVAVEVLVERGCCPSRPGRPGSARPSRSTGRRPSAPTRKIDDQARGAGRRRPRRASARWPEPVGYSTVKSSPKKRRVARAARSTTR